MFSIFKKPKSQGEKVRDKKRAFRRKYIKNDIAQLEYRKELVEDELTKINKSIEDKKEEFARLQDER